MLQVWSDSDQWLSGKAYREITFLQAEKTAAEFWKRAQVQCGTFYQNAITLAIIELSEIWFQILGLHKLLNEVDMKYFFGILDKGGAVRLHLMSSYNLPLV